MDCAQARTQRHAVRQLAGLSQDPCTCERTCEVLLRRAGLQLVRDGAPMKLDRMSHELDRRTRVRPTATRKHKTTRWLELE